MLFMVDVDVVDGVEGDVCECEVFLKIVCVVYVYDVDVV